MPKFRKMFFHSEEERIAAICEALRTMAKVGFVVDDTAKADRYLAKIKAQCPALRVMFRGPGPSKHCYTVTCTLQPDPVNN